MLSQRIRLNTTSSTGRLVTGVVFVVGSLVAWAIAAKFMRSGLPDGEVVQGLVIGGLNSFTAMGLVIIYRSIRIINFAQAAMGSVATALAILLVTGSHWSYWVAVPIGIGAVVVAGLLVDLLIKWRFSQAPRLIVTVVTIGVAQVLGFISLEMTHLFNGKLSPFSTFTTPFHLNFAIRPQPMTGNYIVAMAVVPVALIALYWFFVKTDSGVAIRGAADSSERAELLGIPVRRLTRIVWMVAGGLSGIGAILSQPIAGNGSGLGAFAIASSILVPLAAFVLAGMESLPMAVVWSMIIGVVQQSVFFSYGTHVYSDVALFGLILIGLIFQRSKMVRVTDSGLGDYVAIREVAKIPRAFAKMPEVRFGRIGVLGIVAVLAIAVPWMTGASATSAAVTTVVYAIIAVSMVVLVGWAGQISLGQFGFGGLGACLAGAFMVHLHFPFIATLLIGGAAGAILAALVGIPAFRLEGTALAVVTLAFAVVMSTYILSSEFFPWLDPSKVTPPTIAKRFSLATPYTGLYEFALVILGLTILGAVALRRSRTGRAILSVRDNPRASSAYGISPLRSKLIAFAISGFIAGVAGVVYIVHLGGISTNGFQATYSINLFIMVVIGGLGSVTGGVLGAIYVTVVSTQLNAAGQLLGTGAGVLLVLIIFPEGLGGAVFRLRDAIIRFLARAKGLSSTSEANDAIVASDNSFGAKPAVGHAHTAALRLSALEELETQGTPAGLSSGGVGSANADPPEGQEALISISELDVSYGSSQVLFGVGLGVARQEIVALLGTNGAGKSTVLRAVAGLVKPKRGGVVFAGKDMASLGPAERVRAGLVTVLGGRSIFSSLSVEENLRLAAWTARRVHHDEEFADSATERVLNLFPVLRERQDQRAGLLSGGEQQMLALGQALLCRPRLLLIDELSLGLAPSIVSDLLEVIRALAASGVTVVVIEQSVNIATAISNRAIFMERGRIRFSGPTPDLSEQPELLRSVFFHAAERARKRKGLPAAAPGIGAGAAAPVSKADAVFAALTGEGPMPAADAGDTPFVASAASGSVTSVTPPAPLPGYAPGVPAIAAHTDPPGALQEDGSLEQAAFAVLGVSKSFGGVSALASVSLHVNYGEILGVIGSNGAGKTSLFDVCSGFTRPDAGFVEMDGVDVTALSPAKRAERGLGRVFQDARLWPSMTVHEAIATSLEQFVPVRDPIAAALYLADVERSEAEVQERTDMLIQEFGLGRFREQYVAALSTGTRRIVELACAIGHDPKVLLLDEPTSGIAQRESEALGELLLALRDQTGAAFIVIEHDVPLVSSLADRMVCMHLGEVITEGDTSDVLTDPLVVAAYLGGDDVTLRQAGKVPVDAGAAARRDVSGFGGSHE